MKLRRLQQASFLPCTVENDKRQLQAQSQSRSTSKSDISSGAFLVVLQLTMDIMLSPPSYHERCGGLGARASEVGSGCKSRRKGILSGSKGCTNFASLTFFDLEGLH